MTEGIVVMLLLDFAVGVFVGFLLARRYYKPAERARLEFDDRLRK
jgi:uncharacterized protein YneF (UPF0154 family)